MMTVELLVGGDFIEEPVAYKPDLISVAHVPIEPKAISHNIITPSHPRVISHVNWCRGVDGVIQFRA